MSPTPRTTPDTPDTPSPVKYVDFDGNPRITFPVSTPVPVTSSPTVLKSVLSFYKLLSTPLSPEDEEKTGKKAHRTRTLTGFVNVIQKDTPDFDVSMMLQTIEDQSSSKKKTTPSVNVDDELSSLLSELS